MAIPIEVEPGLCEEVVLGHVLAEERVGRATAWRRESEELYGLPAGMKRDQGFRALALNSFAALDCGGRLHALVAEFEPRFPGVTRAVFQRANRPSQEGAELHVSGAASVVRTEVSVTRMMAGTALDEFVRSEWTHVADMLDPSFAYVPDDLERAGETPFERRLIRERYRALWTASVTGRLSREGKTPEGAEARRRDEVHRAYAKLAEEARERCFLAMWSGPRPTHAELLALAQGPSAVFERFGAGTAASKGARRMPGDPCPLCRFPAWKWADATAMQAKTREALVKDFPTWQTEDSICDRCDEMYRARTGCW